MTIEQYELLRKHYIACNKYTSEQEIAVAMVHRINEALNILRILEVNVPFGNVVYHHYNHSVEESCPKTKGKR